MSKSNDKYHMFREFMFNELGVSRDDIKAWIKEAIQDEVKRQYMTAITSEAVTKQLLGDTEYQRRCFRDEILKQASEKIVSMIDLNLKEKKTPVPEVKTKVTFGMLKTGAEFKYNGKTYTKMTASEAEDLHARLHIFSNGAEID